MRGDDYGVPQSCAVQRDQAVEPGRNGVRRGATTGGRGGPRPIPLRRPYMGSHRSRLFALRSGSAAHRRDLEGCWDREGPRGRVDGPRGPAPEGESLADPRGRRLRRGGVEATRRGLRRRAFRDLDLPEVDVLPRRRLRGRAPRGPRCGASPRRSGSGDPAISRDPRRGLLSSIGSGGHRDPPRSRAPGFRRGGEHGRWLAIAVRRRLGARSILRDRTENPDPRGVPRRGQSKGDIFRGSIERKRRRCMKAVVLAAGEGTRMRPLTANLPKPLLPVAGKPFLRHTLEALGAAGAREIAILIGWQGHRIRERFGDGKALGLTLEYEEQGERLGTAHAIGCMRKHVDGTFLSVNGDVVASAPALSELLAFHQKVRGPIMALAEVPNPRAFGVVEMKDGKVAALEEKPRQPKSNLINAGIYVFDEDIFPLIDSTPKSPRGEYEITDTIRMLMAKREVYGFRLPGEWIDVGRPWDLLRANTALLTPLKGANHGHLDPGATLVGEVLVEEGATVRRGSYIEGPTIVGADAEIGPNCYIRPSTSIGPKAKVGNACEVKNSILMASAHVPHQNYVGDSILGERCNLGAGTKVANLRLDEDAVKVVFRGVEIDTGLRKLGVIMGDDVKVGINASIDAGTIIGEEAFLGPGAHARGNIAPRSRIF